MLSRTNALYNFFQCFLHPIKISRDWRTKRHDEREEEFLPLVDVVVSAWMIKAIYTFYALLWPFLGFHFFNYYQKGPPSWALGLDELLGFNIHILGFGALFFWLLFRLALFPITLFFYAKFWFVIVRFFCGLFLTGRRAEDSHLEVYRPEFSEEQMNKMSKEVVHLSLTTYTLHLIPIFGKRLTHLAQIFYLYLGLRKNIGMTNLQSIIVILSPLLLLGSLLALWLLSLTMFLFLMNT